MSQRDNVLNPFPRIMSFLLPVPAASLAVATSVLLAVQPAGQTAARTAPRADPALAVTHVTVVDGLSPRPRSDWTVVVRDGKIVAAGPAGSTPVPSGTRVVDGRGRYLIPGLWDMHAHLEKRAARLLPEYVAAGVTYIRELGSMPMSRIDSVHALEDGGRIIGARIVGAGYMVETPNSIRFFEDLARKSAEEGHPQPDWRVGHLAAANPAEAVAVADSIAASGSHIMKVIDAVNADTYFALARAARERGLLFDGHLLFPRLVTVRQSVDSGQRGFEHLFNLTFGLDPLPDSARASLYARMREKRVAFIPTLFTNHWWLMPGTELAALAADSLGLRDARNRYLDPETRASWSSRIAMQRDPQRDIPADRVRLMWTRGLALLREMHAAGVDILPGTDLGGFLVYPGSSLHEELAMLESEVGFTPHEVLASATLAPARFLGMADSIGTIAPGKNADLVLLTGDPMQSVKNLSAVDAVILRGRLLRRATLDSALTVVRRR